MRRLLAFAFGTYIVLIGIALSTPAQAEIIFRTHLLDSPDNTYRTDYAEVKFSVSRDGVSFTLHNESSDPIQLVWDEMALVDNHRVSHQVVHSGVRIIHIGLSQPPTTVAPQSSYSDTIYAADKVSDSGTPAPFITTASAGEEIGLVIAIRKGDKIETMMVRFRIDQYTAIVPKPDPNLAQAKNPLVAGILSFLVPSAGHLYAGNWPRGLAYGIPRMASLAWMIYRVETDPDAKTTSPLDLPAALGILVLPWVEAIDSAIYVSRESNRIRAGIEFDPARRQVALVYVF